MPATNLKEVSMSQVFQDVVQSMPRVHADVRAWIEECIALCKPEKLYWCDGSERERRELIEQGVREGIFIRLNQEKRPIVFCIGPIRMMWHAASI
jgi:phosphoenolpyruvate carboxykinase (GTP)